MSRQPDYRYAQKRFHSRTTSAAGRLNVPRTPVQRIMLSAKLLRMKREFLERQGAC